MSRADLLALTPAAVAALSSPGLVKRALREIDAGSGPAIEEHGDGVVSGHFPDGTVATLPPGVAIRDAVCTCGAAGACRHRVAVALAYRRWHESRAEAPPAPESDESSPGNIDDEALRAAVGKRILNRSRDLRRLGCDVEVARRSAGRPPEARLPTCTVQFLVPRDLAYARCDCVAGQRCEHIALAVWAFREADRRGWPADVQTVHLSPPAVGALRREPLAEARSFSRELLLEGAVNLPPAIAARLARARTALDGAGMTWPGTILDDVEDLLAAYRNRSARYTPSSFARLLGEMAARADAADHGTELPARYVLGIGESRETTLGHVRLVSIGARVHGGGRERWVDLYLADPVAGVVLVLRKTWTFDEREEPDDGPRLAARHVVAGVTLKTLAAGQVVTRIAKRSANRTLRLGGARRGAISVTAQTGDWSDLPDGIVVRDFARYAERLKARPPRWLRPRVLAETTHVVAVDRVLDVAFAPGTQALVAAVTDAAGVPLRVVLHYRSVAPHAAEALARVMTGDPPLRFLSGALYAGEHGLEMVPVAAVANRVVVPDLEAAAEAPLRLGEVALDESDLSIAIGEAWSCLVDGAHTGLLRPSPAWLDRLERAATRAEEIGFGTLASRLNEVGLTVRRASAAATANDPTALAAAAAWERAAIRVALTRELL